MAGPIYREPADDPFLQVRPTRRPHLARWFVGALAACAVRISFASTAAIAQGQRVIPLFDASSFDANRGADPLAIEPPVGTPQIAKWNFDPTFAVHGWGIDRVSDSSAKNYYGRRIARLDNGDIVVAGLVPRSGSSISDQLDLVRFTAAGRRIAWTSVDPIWSRNVEDVPWSMTLSGGILRRNRAGLHLPDVRRGECEQWLSAKP